MTESAVCIIRFLKPGLLRIVLSSFITNVSCATKDDSETYNL